MLYLDKEEQVVGLKFKSQVTGQKCLRIYLYHILKTHWVHSSEKLHPLIGTKEVAKVIAILNAMREETKRFPSMIIYAVLTGHSSTFHKRKISRWIANFLRVSSEPIVPKNWRYFFLWWAREIEIQRRSPGYDLVTNSIYSDLWNGKARFTFNFNWREGHSKDKGLLGHTNEHPDWSDVRAKILLYQSKAGL